MLKEMSEKNSNRTISKEDLFEQGEVDRYEEDVDSDLRANGESRLALTKDDRSEGRLDVDGNDKLVLKRDGDVIKEQSDAKDEAENSNVELTIRGPLSHDITRLLQEQFGFSTKEDAREGTGTVTNKAALIVLAKERKYQHNSVRGLGSPFIYMSDDRWLSLATERSKLVTELESIPAGNDILIGIGKETILTDSYRSTLEGLGAKIYYTGSALARAIYSRFEPL
jgi:hypothetical protein